MSNDPALVFEARPTRTPGTHVLLIGVGTYDHLEGGSGALFSNALGQLDSPPTSAVELANWFFEDYENPAKQLASLAMIVSSNQPLAYSAPGGSTSVTLPMGTGSEVEMAVRAWAKRSASHPDNLSIFFFCGHGVENPVETFLLARDFGADPHAHSDGIINAGSIKATMRVIGPSEQVYVLDSCRNRDDRIVDAVLNGRAPLAARPGVMAYHTPQQALISSTDAGLKAYGRIGEPSVFTAGLLVALRSAAKQNGSNEWWVSAADVQAQIAVRTEHIQSSSFDGRSVAICKLKDEPKIPVRVRCKPAETIRMSLLSCSEVDGTPCCCHTGHPPLVNDLWEPFLNQGEYVFKATATVADSFEPVSARRYVHPPYTSIELATLTRSGGGK